MTRRPHALRRVRNNRPDDIGRRVHLQVQDAPGGQWRQVCHPKVTYPELVIDGSVVTCQRCRTSGLVPARWLDGPRLAGRNTP